MAGMTTSPGPRSEFSIDVRPPNYPRKWAEYQVVETVLEGGARLFGSVRATFLNRADAERELSRLISLEG